jgi:hypothetical protein
MTAVTVTAGKSISGKSVMFRCLKPKMPAKVSRMNATIGGIG